MTLDQMNVSNQLIGGRRRRRRGQSKRKQSKSRQSKRGGTFLADASVPAGLFLLHKYLKNKKSRKSSKKSSKKLTRRRR
tara:strand:- start:1311 stop:1547 length:237 start_codon:yes stop_codon:yes gene_type:complete